MKIKLKINKQKFKAKGTFGDIVILSLLFLPGGFIILGLLLLKRYVYERYKKFFKK